MRLDRNINQDGRGKYALIKLRDVKRWPMLQIANDVVVPASAVDFGDSPSTDFFVIRLKDKHAVDALEAYAKSAALDDAEYGAEVMELARRAAAMKGRSPD